LVLAIGGMTVEELRYRITYHEIQGWELFEEEYGPLHLALRIERSIAQAVQPFLKDAKMRDLMPWPKEPEQEATVEDFMRMLKPAKKPLRSR
jgi:hypothetical protein